jgi:hypothetical protein
MRTDYETTELLGFAIVIAYFAMAIVGAVSLVVMYTHWVS